MSILPLMYAGLTLTTRWHKHSMIKKEEENKNHLQSGKQK